MHLSSHVNAAFCDSGTRSRSWPLVIKRYQECSGNALRSEYQNICRCDEKKLWKLMPQDDQASAITYTAQCVQLMLYTLGFSRNCIRVPPVKYLKFMYFYNSVGGNTVCSIVIISSLGEGVSKWVSNVHSKL